MSTLVTENLQDSGGTVPVATVRQGSAKAWLTLTGTGTITFRDSFNHSTVTDLGPGTYQSNLSTALGNANYAMVAMATFIGGPYISGHNTGGPQTSSTYINVSSTTAGGGVDSTLMTSQVQGDLA